MGLIGLEELYFEYYEFDSRFCKLLTKIPDDEFLVYVIDKLMEDLSRRELVSMLVNAEQDEIRRCTICGKPMSEGYYAVVIMLVQRNACWNYMMEMKR